ncbi:transketolase [Candidatus Pseudothioglobus singularis]|nr:transketolase [Candidatus Pseudothioglobus singularis]
MINDISNSVRINALLSIYNAGSGHPGGVLSSIDLILYLFIEEMKYDKSNFSLQERDRFILSKGHSSPALYAVAAEVGIIDKSSLNGFRKINNKMQGHTHRGVMSWVEASTGSLGQGFSFSIGEAKGLKLLNNKNRVYVMLGDGEIQEGEVWEGAMFSAHHNLDNLCAVIDYNKMQSDDFNKNIIGLEPLAEKWNSFGWNVIEIDGHDFNEMAVAFDSARNCIGRPTIIIAHTIKGKGVSYMEGSPLWHGSLKLSDQDLTLALKELGLSNEKIEEIINE